jgi:LysR family nitrogen assimilation transcriptional regulator
LHQFEVTPLGEERLYLLSKKSSTGTRPKISLDELSQMPLTMPSHPNAIRLHVENALRSRGHQMRIEYEVDGVASIIRLVAKSYGHAILTRAAIEGLGKQHGLQYRPIMLERNRVLSIPLSLATHRTNKLTLTQKNMMTTLTQMVKHHHQKMAKLF